MSGITKREPPISWRPSPAAREKLARLVSETKLSRNDLLNQAIAQYRDKVVPVINEPENVKVKAVEFPAGKPKTGIKIDREKVLAFQNKTGMDRAAKRK